MRFDLFDALALLGLGQIITGLWILGPLWGLIGGGALILASALALARLKARASK